VKNRIRNAAIVLALGIIAVSCGDARGPLSSGPETQFGPIVAQVANPEGVNFFVFGDAALALTKRGSAGVTTQEQKDEKIVDARKNATLKVKFRKYDSPLRVIEAEFKIKKNSIGDATPVGRNRYLIGMKVVSGQSLNQMVVTFKPKGMSFTPAAKLKLKVKSESDLENLVAYHIDPDGTVTQVKMKVKKERSYWKLEIEVHSFSQYSYDDDEMNQESDY